MLEAALWGFAGGAALLVGAIVGLTLCPGKRTVAFVLAFGAGVLISAVSFDLTAEAFVLGGAGPTALGLAAGALVFFAGDTLVERRGGREHQRRDGGEGGGAATSSGRESEEGGTPRALVLGALLDGIPESAAIGLTLLDGGAVSGAFVVAVCLSNLPESISASAGFAKAGRSRGWILGLWLSIALVSALSAALGYQLLGGASDELVAAVNGFAAGAILCMLANTMIPQAYVDGKTRVVGLFTVLGFALAALLSSGA